MKVGNAFAAESTENNTLLMNDCYRFLLLPSVYSVFSAAKKVFRVVRIGRAYEIQYNDCNGLASACFGSAEPGAVDDLFREIDRALESREPGSGR